MSMSSARKLLQAQSPAQKGIDLKEVKEHKKPSDRLFDLSLLPSSLICPKTKRPFTKPHMLISQETIDESALNAENLQGLKLGFEVNNLKSASVPDENLKKICEDFFKLFNELKGKTNDLALLDAENAELLAKVKQKEQRLEKLERTIKQLSPSKALNLKWRKALAVDEKAEVKADLKDQTNATAFTMQPHTDYAAYATAVFMLNGKACTEEDAKIEGGKYLKNLTLRKASAECAEKFKWYQEHFVHLEKQYSALERQKRYLLKAFAHYPDEIEKLTVILEDLQQEAFAKQTQAIVDLQSKVETLQYQLSAKDRELQEIRHEEEQVADEDHENPEEREGLPRVSRCQC
jgi:predicted RNase H-like nuclease (RuvC/YqgF family)